MYWQLAATLLVVAVAAAYLARRVWHTWSARGCAGGCGCAKSPGTAAPPVLLAPEDLRLRRREPKLR